MHYALHIRVFGITIILHIFKKGLILVDPSVNKTAYDQILLASHRFSFYITTITFLVPWLL